LEEEQLHLNVGLNKIAETVGQVEEMQKSLAVKSAELQAKNDAANAKLKQMVFLYFFGFLKIVKTKYYILFLRLKTNKKLKNKKLILKRYRSC
jgi:hypothetical protein